MSGAVPGPRPQPQSTMLTTLWLLLHCAVLGAGFNFLVSCPQGKECQQALLSGHDVILQCNISEPSWSYSRQSPGVWEINPLEFPNINLTPEGDLAITNPVPGQTGIYQCSDEYGVEVIHYEIDFQDISTLHVTHKDLGQKPLKPETLQLGSQELVFTQWEPWQECNRCEVPGERKRLGYCYIKDPLGDRVPCGLYQAHPKMWSSRLRPELQVEGCHVQCNQDAPSSVDYVVFDTFKLTEDLESVWLTCPSASIYRPVNWEVNSTSLTWRGQLSGENLGTFFNPSTGGRNLQIFQPAIYRCFVGQELMAQFNPEVSPEMLEARKRKNAAHWRRTAEVNSGLKGLKLVLLVGAVICLVGILFKVLCPARGKTSKQVLLVK